jgi:hypothetical protein
MALKPENALKRAEELIGVRVCVGSGDWTGIGDSNWIRRAMIGGRRVGGGWVDGGVPYTVYRIPAVIPSSFSRSRRRVAP